MVSAQTLKDGRVVFRDSKGRFISIKDAEAREQIAKPMQKIVTFRERIRGTRVARIVQRSYPVEHTEDEIREDLESQYDRGRNYVIALTNIRIGRMEQEEREIETLGPNSGDSS